MHGGKSTGPKDKSSLKDNQRAAKHGVWSRLLTPEDEEFLALDPAERLATLQGLAELRAFRAHQAAAEKEGGDDTLDVAFTRNARTAVAMVRARLSIAEAAAEGVTLDHSQGGDDNDAEVMGEDERVDRLARLLDSMAAAADGAAAGSPAVEPGQPAADRGPAQSG